MRHHTKWFILTLILCILCNFTPLAFASAADTDSTEGAPTSHPAKWNVLLYLCGTDLETDSGLASNNLKMIAETQPSEDVNVLVQTGGAKEWQATERLGFDIASDRLQRWSYSEDGFTLVDEQENASMARYSTLADFIKWSAANYPAEKNILIVWDHGGGSAGGLIQDELHDNAVMSLDGLEQALNEGGVHFDIFMTDTCLMASLETAQAVMTYADYLAASEEILPGSGTDYKEWLQNLYDDPGCSAERLGENICNATQVMYTENGDNADLKGLTFSVIDLSRIDAVAEAFEAFMKEVLGLLDDPADFGVYLDAVSQTDRFLDRNMWDLYDLAKMSVEGGISKETAIKLENAVDDAVITIVRGSYHPYAHGLSAFLCYNEDCGLLDRLARTSRNPWQLAFLDAVNLKWDAPAWATDIVGDIPQLKPELYTVDFDTGVTEDQSNVLLRVNSGFSSGGFIRYELQRYDDELQVWYSLGENEDVDVVGADGDTFTVETGFSGKWPALAGEFLSVRSKDLQGNTVLMQAPVYNPELGGINKLCVLAEYPEEMLLLSEYAEEDAITVTAEEDEEENAMTVTVDEEDTPAMEGSKHAATDEAAEDEEDSTSYRIAGIWNGYDSATGLSDRNAWSAAELDGTPFNVCKPVYSDYLDDIGDVRLGEEFVLEPDLAVEDAVLPAGDYRLRYSISDMLDRTYASEFFYFTWDGEAAIFDLPEEE